MNQGAGLATLGFLSIFHLIGGLSVGIGLRRLSRGFSLEHIFFIVWGGFFGGAPLLIGESELLSRDMPVLFLTELVIFFGAIVTATLIPGWFVELFNSAEIKTIAFGGFFLLLGLGIGAAILRQQWLVAILFFVGFGVTGGILLIRGLRSLFTEKK